MKSVEILINNKKIIASTNETILTVASREGVFIPTLCFNKEFCASGACGICAVEIEGTPKLFRACNTQVANGQVILTDTSKTKRAVRSVLELLLSDHTGDCKAPCSLACPAETDCMGYVNQIANDDIGKAIETLYKKLPFPNTLGRVCPHPCETACRRKLVEEPIAIASLKWFVADKAISNFTPPKPNKNTNKKVAIIGGGPAGLTIAYYLRQKGHSVTVFEKNSTLGGMLHYGVPQYRLPKDILSKEIKIILSTGIDVKTGVTIGKDISLEKLQSDFDAVIVAVGASKGQDLDYKGIEKDGVINGIEFLSDVSGRGENAKKTKFLSYIKNKIVAVVGGGDTAMDTARTAIRLGAKDVKIFYRRSREQMPANLHEIEEAIEEGVILHTLVNPVEIFGNNKVEGVVLQKQELIVPSDGSRPYPKPTDETEYMKIDTIIGMIGQKVEISGLEELAVTKWGTIVADEKTFATNLEKVFAIGDCTNKGASIAVEAIGEANRCAEVVDRFLISGEIVGVERIVIVENEKKESDFQDVKKIERAKVKQLASPIRKINFKEVNKVISENVAKKEAKRCLECGCGGLEKCKLFEYANQYKASVSKFTGEKHNIKKDNSSSRIARDMNKCILCGLCVLACEKSGANILGRNYRGFITQIKTELNKPLAKTGCISCASCVKVCPTGAIVEKNEIE
ncbi:MAG: FAD-dependent oxidoreductase [Firmicutes bacterium]|nr:FAD-dependent oxidoreductase [Bacillota bacterium]